MQVRSLFTNLRSTLATRRFATRSSAPYCRLISNVGNRHSQIVFQLVHFNTIGTGSLSLEQLADQRSRQLDIKILGENELVIGILQVKALWIYSIRKLYEADAALLESHLLTNEQQIESHQSQIENIFSLAPNIHLDFPDPELPELALEQQNPIVPAIKSLNETYFARLKWLTLGLLFVCVFLSFNHPCQLALIVTCIALASALKKDSASRFPEISFALFLTIAVDLLYLWPYRVTDWTSFYQEFLPGRIINIASPFVIAIGMVLKIAIFLELRNIRRLSSTS